MKTPMSLHVRSFGCWMQLLASILGQLGLLPLLPHGVVFVEPADTVVVHGFLGCGLLLLLLLLGGHVSKVGTAVGPRDTLGRAGQWGLHRSLRLRLGQLVPRVLQSHGAEIVEPAGAVVLHGFSRNAGHGGDGGSLVGVGCHCWSFLCVV